MDKYNRLRTLDARVAEKIMGWYRVRYETIGGGPSHLDNEYWLCRPQVKPEQISDSFVPGGKGKCDYDCYHFSSEDTRWQFTVPKFSTDLNEAWRVLETMQKELEIPWSLYSNRTGVVAHFQRIYETSPHRISAHHESKGMAEAICRAALKALELDHAKEKEKRIAKRNSIPGNVTNP